MIEGCQGCTDEAKPFIFRGPGPYRRDIVHDHPPEEPTMTTPEPQDFIPPEQLEQVRKDLQNAIAEDMRVIGINAALHGEISYEYPFGERPELSSYTAPQAVPLSRQNLNWLEPAFLDVLASHGLGWVWGPDLEQIKLACGGENCTREFTDEQEWREHVWAELEARCIKAAGR